MKETRGEQEEGSHGGKAHLEEDFGEGSEYIADEDFEEMDFGAWEEDQPEDATEEDDELPEGPGVVERVSQPHEEEEIEDKGCVLVWLAQEFGHEEGADAHGGDEGGDEGHDFAWVAEGLLQLDGGYPTATAA